MITIREHNTHHRKRKCKKRFPNIVAEFGMGTSNVRLDLRKVRRPSKFTDICKSHCAKLSKPATSVLGSKMKNQLGKAVDIVVNGRSKES